MIKIKNFQKLAISPLRRKILKIAEAGLSAVDAGSTVRDELTLTGDILRIKNIRLNLAQFRRIFAVGIGKCAYRAGQALERILGSRITAGIIADVRQDGELQYMSFRAGTHPRPTEKNIDITKAIIKLLQDLDERDLVIFVISGGGSVLLCQPGNFTCQQESLIMQCLTRAGAPISEMNLVRKHLSFARGGFLTKYAYPAQVVSLIFSDVPGDDLAVIASGPTVRDPTTVREAWRILERYDKEKCYIFFQKELIETPKDQKYFKKVRNVMILNNRKGLRAMAESARSLGFRPKIVTSILSGEAEAVSLRVVRALRRAAPSQVLLFGGETTVTLKNFSGRGGRNMTLALRALPEIADGEVILPFASDGRDNSEFAGGICDILTKERAQKLRLDPEAYLERNQTYDFFKKTKQYLLTGVTGTNVSDLVIAAKI